MNKSEERQLLFKKRNANNVWHSGPKYKKNKNSDFSFPERSSEKQKDGLRSLRINKVSGLMSPRMRDRSESMDLIPACVPDSVGLEIEHILHNSFNTGRTYLESELSSDMSNDTATPARRNERKPSRRRSSPHKKKSPRMSTEDLPPNLLPEDYLDEVISQYFNNDSSSEDQANCDTAAKTRRASLKEMLSENSTNEDEDETEEEIVPDDNPQLDDNIKKNKIKTDEEIESEYKHIIFGAKKRKGPRLGLGSPKKKKKKKSSKERGDNLTDSSESAIKLPKAEKISLKNSRKFEEDTIKVENKKLRIHQVEPEPVQDSLLEKLDDQGDNILQKWSGKRASKRAVEKSKLFHSPRKPQQPLYNTSSKIEDVTGKYSKEEEMVSCGICELMDPPVDPDNPNSTAQTTEWVGCDCYRWFHKSCTKLTKFTEKFSCKSVKMKCQEVQPTPDSCLSKVLQVAILKFFRDRDVTFIEDILW